MDTHRLDNPGGTMTDLRVASQLSVEGLGMRAEMRELAGDNTSSFDRNSFSFLTSLPISSSTVCSLTFRTCCRMRIYLCVVVYLVVNGHVGQPCADGSQFK